MKRIISLLLGALLCVSLCACEITDTYPDSSVGATQPEEKITELEQISLVYFDDKGTHPLLETSQTNRQVGQSIYQPLLTFDEKLDIKYGCALAVSVSNTTVTITPDTTRHFSDGSVLTPHLIAQSIEFILEHPESPYYRQLSSVESADVQSGLVILKLKEKDPGILYCLNVPIVKESEGKYYGCGDYMLSKFQNAPALLANPHTPTKPKLAPIPLLDPASESTMATMFNSGVLDVLTSDMMASGTLSISREYKSVSYLTNTMLYVGINAEQDTPMRQALGKMIPREDIVKSVLMGGGVATARPFYPKWSALPTETLATPEKAELLEAFKKAGFSVKNGELITAEGENPSLDLLVCENDKTHTAAAEKIKSAAAALGLEINLNVVDEQTFLNRLENGYFDLYIARFVLNPNMDPSELYAEQSDYNYGNMKLPKLEKSWAKYRNGQDSLEQYLNRFEKDAPLLPIAFIKSSVYYTEGISLAGSISHFSPLGQLGAWKTK